ncbi:hypothetical protein EDD29_4082 [Actinocorallia herbida]|uniref:Uncharacterized protein n=1 Tax=Actinocorallia herbida TaxID=58109 RepID=A0A3N1CZ11_9ACTN|nr:hypothetical protein [Actinocorallia herbida]ROO86509.1 hypothetical protein EDD29_4082 [Actinocorallia herbida]
MAEYMGDGMSPEQARLLDEAQVAIGQALDDVRKRMPDLEVRLAEWPGPGDASCMSEDGCEGFTGTPSKPCRTLIPGGRCGHAFTRHWVY